VTLEASGIDGGDWDRPRIVPELLLGLAIFALYSVVAGDDRHRQAEAIRNGRWLFAAEQWLHLDIEPALNRWLAPHTTLETIANYEYATTYVVAAFGLLAWLYLRRPAEYRWARWTFVLVNLIGIGCFAVVPVAPPRFMPDLGFVDTVRLSQTWGSWGSPLVAHANQVAAMPSLHIAWAVWVSAVLARLSSARAVQVSSAVHVLVTLFVVMATANHYLVDAVAGGLAVGLAAAIVRRLPIDRRPRVPAADAFFLHVESPVAAQQVGGLAVLDTSAVPFSRDGLAATVRAHLDELPRFRQRLSPPSRWRRPRWVDHPDLDWDWHVPERDLTGPDGQPGGMAALDALVAELASTALPRDRPLWRFVAVRGVTSDRAAAILIVHHVIADGLGTVAQAMTMLEPVVPASRGLEARPRGHGPEPPPPRRGRDWPGAARRLLATGIGLAQLATDGRPSLRLPVGDSAVRGFGTVTLPLDEVRTVARQHGARVSDVLLASVAGGLRRALGATAPDGPAPLRVSVPLMVRQPGAAAEGNLTAGVMTNVPLGPLAEPERLAEVARRSRVLHTGTRALASTFVMRRVGGLMPVPVHAWFARTVYGGAFFQAIVSNMPGPQAPLSLAGPPLAGVFPILPLAPRAPLAVGALGWDGALCVGICLDPALVSDAAALAAAVGAAFAELSQSTGGNDTPAGRRTGGAPGDRPVDVAGREPARRLPPDR
jgi:diacylglycerol O-acyltransferase / wax synthase